MTNPERRSATDIIAESLGDLLLNVDPGQLAKDIITVLAAHGYTVMPIRRTEGLPIIWNGTSLASIRAAISNGATTETDPTLADIDEVSIDRAYVAVEAAEGDLVRIRDGNDAKDFVIVRLGPTQLLLRASETAAPE